MIPQRIWNIDETEIPGEFGSKTKVFPDAGSNRSRSRIKIGNWKRKHLTSIVIFSAAGELLPPFSNFLWEADNGFMARTT